MVPTLACVRPVLMSRDVTRSIRFYERLGFALAFQDRAEEQRYAGVRRDGVELHLQWHDAGEWTYPNDRPTYRFPVDDVDGLFREFCEAGVTASGTQVRDTAWGTREFHIRDPDDNGLQFYRDL